MNIHEKSKGCLYYSINQSLEGELGPNKESNGKIMYAKPNRELSDKIMYANPE